MRRSLMLGYGVACYLLFLIAFLYSIGFVADFAVPKGIDDGVPGGWGASITIDVLLLGLFAVQHSVMARPAFKRAWVRVVPAPAERSTYVLFTCLALFFLFWQWRPLPSIIWNVETPAMRVVLWVLCACGWAIVTISTFLIDHFELTGLRQVYLYFTGRADGPGSLKFVGFYRLVRHPLMTGFLIAFWATPTMSAGHLLFAAVSAAYILLAVQVEERDLVAHFGDDYRKYRREVGMLVPKLTRTRIS